MSVKNNYSSLSIGLGAAAVLVSGSCLAVSVVQSGLFIRGTMGNGIQSTVMIAGVTAILFGSQILARLSGQAIKAKSPAWAIVIGILSIVIIESLSVGISAISFDGNLLESSRQTNHSSPEYRQAQQNIELYRDQIQGLQTQISELPADWISRRNEAYERIDTLQARIKSEQRAANAVNVSTSDQAFNRLESSTGISQDKISLIMGLLLSIVPLATNLLCGSLAWTGKTKKKAQPVKKRTPNLRSVAA